MPMHDDRTTASLLVVSLVLACVGCQVEFNDLQKGGKFTCSGDSDCIEGFVCDQRGLQQAGQMDATMSAKPADAAVGTGSSSRGRCVEACSSSGDCKDGFVCNDEQLCVEGCIDEDGDGYGDEGSPALRLCRACQQGGSENPIGCEKSDCDDANETIYPGQTEECDGADNDCDGQTDEPIPCESNGDCPLSAPSDRSNTQIRCEAVSNSNGGGSGGTSDDKECILRGSFSSNPDCPLDKNQATCKNGKWGKIPEACRTP